MQVQPYYIHKKQTIWKNELIKKNEWERDLLDIID